ncbi:hypothetical protein P9D34_14875 [Bacillus swezeyi]|uniref:Uncharacterized protein n=1 Tax=Bacillus swezeyi TaxID=1925020 RepID=A0A1R1QN96_9BACI|nr:hypothetical protein [Bacillus swezeyi]MEC1261717.1 hypothetical protein [Bacillus swezeyi]MED1738374.1 hypothetical protein [Bacillus swezeyi]MED2926420.1 hypothetical protein [Bacillus swezeyi]MED2943890.1 hypothetical protein [Bacillus swezeyi]MED2966017.1 hypothetical protein [Bacillus swezeyi]
MSTRKIGSVISGIAALIVVGFTIYKIIVGKDVGFNEVMSMGALLMIFFSANTWGTKEEQDGILQEEELGQRITEKSSKVSYFLLTFFIFGAVVADQFINETINIFLLLLLGLSMITLPFIEFLVAKKYQ